MSGNGETVGAGFEDLLGGIKMEHSKKQCVYENIWRVLRWFREGKSVTKMQVRYHEMEKLHGGMEEQDLKLHRAAPKWNTGTNSVYRIF